MKYKLSICALLLSSLSVASAQLASHSQQSGFSVPTTQISRPAGRPVVRVNGVVLTDEDLVREEYAIFPYAKQHGGKIPSDMEPGIRKGALDMIVFEELVYQDAQKRNVTIPPERLNKAMAEFRKQFDSPAMYRQYLQAEYNGNEQALRDKVNRSLLIEQLLKAEVDAKSTVTAAELHAFYDKNPQRFQYPESFAIQTISIIPPQNATAAQLQEAKKRADEAYKQAKATKTAMEFGLLAEKLSDDDYRVMLGDHKWVPRPQLPPEVLSPALKMKPGEMSELIKVGPNFVIFRMNKHIPAGITPFAQVKDSLRKELEKEKTDQVRTALNKRLHQSAKVETL